MDDNLLLITVDAGVQLALLDMRARGVEVDEWMLEQAQERFRRMRAGKASESILYRIDGHTSANTAMLIEALAILAHVPGGVDFGGVHFESKGADDRRSIIRPNCANI